MTLNITEQMLVDIIPLLQKATDTSEDAARETGISVEETEWGAILFAGPASTVGMEGDAPTICINDSWTHGGFLVRTIGVFALTEAWIIVLGDDMAGLTGYITRLVQKEGESQAEFHVAWFTRMNEISYLNVAHYY